MWIRFAVFLALLLRVKGQKCHSPVVCDGQAAQATWKETAPLLGNQTISSQKGESCASQIARLKKSLDNLEANLNNMAKRIRGTTVTTAPQIMSIQERATTDLMTTTVKTGANCSVGAAYGGKIPDSSFNASSWYDQYHSARYGRINTPASTLSGGSWAVKSSKIGEWIQVDLGKKTTVIGVKIQGRPKTNLNEWVTSFHVHCGLTTSSMRTITDKTGTIKLFTGNTDRTTIVTHLFPTPQECRYLRIYPQTWERHISMRMDFIESC